MALLIDGGLNSTGDLKAQDSGVLDVASGEGIDLEVKLKSTDRELLVDASRFLQREGEGAPGQIAVDDGMRLWHVSQTLESVYRDAYFSQLNDRYAKRWEHWKAQAAIHRAGCFSAGIGLVNTPLRRPAQVIAKLSDGVAAAATYWIQTTYLNSSGQESTPSEMLVLAAPDLHCLTVSVGQPPVETVGWNLYLSDMSNEAGLQNASPIAPNASWVLSPATLVQPGRTAGEGQAVDKTVQRSGLAWRI